MTCAPTATRTRDLPLRRSFRVLRSPTALVIRTGFLVVLVLLEAARFAPLWARRGHALPRHPSMDSPTPPPKPIGAETRDRAGSVRRRRSRSRRDAVGALDRFCPVPIIPWRVGGRPCTFSGIGDGQRRTPARGAGFPRAGAGEILSRPRRTVGGEKAGRPEPYTGGAGARAPAWTVLRVLVALVLVVSGVLVAGAAAGRRGRPAKGDRERAR